MATKLERTAVRATLATETTAVTGSNNCKRAAVAADDDDGDGYMNGEC